MFPTYFQYGIKNLQVCDLQVFNFTKSSGDRATFGMFILVLTLHLLHETLLILFINTKPCK